MENVEEKLESIQEHKKNGEIVIMTEEGAMISKLENIVKQPVDGLLYDLNRDYATLATMAKSSKSLRWVNDMAIANVLEYVLNNYNSLKNQNEDLSKKCLEFKENYDDLIVEKLTLEEELKELKEEYGRFAKDQFNDPRKYQYDITPIPTASKPSIEKTNQNASKIVPGFNDQLNICL